jgi:hypothetical protein
VQCRSLYHFGARALRSNALQMLDVFGSDIAQIVRHLYQVRRDYPPHLAIDIRASTSSIEREYSRSASLTLCACEGVAGSALSGPSSRCVREPARAHCPSATHNRDCPVSTARDFPITARHVTSIHSTNACSLRVASAHSRQRSTSPRATTLPRTQTPRRA